MTSPTTLKVIAYLVPSGFLLLLVRHLLLVAMHLFLVASGDWLRNRFSIRQPGTAFDMQFRVDGKVTMDCAVHEGGQTGQTWKWTAAPLEVGFYLEAWGCKSNCTRPDSMDNGQIS